ncbi:nuclear transport factor 2 family protein [Nocardioides caricicola]|uniref:Nuclear transport factor 2 family protein n=1 Tax=Nocardioides caricicola TaxID=634770 RepID=A0ABW0N3P7_9ACTN
MTLPTVTVVGLGRMGAALLDRLLEQGFDATGWTRSEAGRPLAEAVRGRGVVVLAVFDGAACRDVLADIVDVGVVVNTATVGPAEAAELAELAVKAGVAYVHAPVLGSVGAVTAGTLTVIAGGDVETPGVADVLSAVSARVITARGVADAAALKLVGAAALASALDGVRTAWTAARALGVPDEQAVELLSHTAFGGLVGSKRGQLLGEEVPDRADFAVGALAKDLGLVQRSATSTPPTLAAVLERAAAAGSGEDVAVLARPGTGVTAPLEDYARGHATRDPAYFRRAFLPTAHVEGLRDGAFTSWDLDGYTALFDGRPDPREAEFSRTIDSVRVDGTVATATMTLDHGESRFTDMFVLVRTGDGWRIANKVYHRH